MFFLSLIVEDSEKGMSLEDKLKSSLDKIDKFSKKASESIKRKYDDTKKKFDSENKNSNLDELFIKAKDGASSLNSSIKSGVKNANIESKISWIKENLNLLGKKTISFSKYLLSVSPYLIPSIIIFQTGLWLAYLSEGTISNNIITIFVEEIGENSRFVIFLLSIYGYVICLFLLSEFNLNDDIFTFEPISISPFYDIIVILLFVSSILYLMKSSKSLYYLSISFIGSLLIRLNTTENTENDILILILCIFGMLGIFGALSTTFLKNKFNSNSEPLLYHKESVDSIDVDYLLKFNYSETSYPMPILDRPEWNMDNAPINPPKRPTRRSEYELYEWVGLLANIILWPTTLGISLLIGSGYEISGTPLSLEENYIMLIGPVLMTGFFFFMQYKMDSSARDGSLYAAQKQAYLDEMDKYVEAKKAYLELVTLQAQIRKEQLMQENPSINPISNDTN